jgi:uncharacterized protein (DUF2236 family)
VNGHRWAPLVPCRDKTGCMTSPPDGRWQTQPVLPFTPGDASWRVNREPAVLVFGGPRAALLQVAHPKVAAGVEDHSDYKTDPFGRSWRTLDWLFKIQFSDPDTVRTQAEILHAVHQRVAGVTPRGEPYRALDPSLLLWVWATLVDSFALAYHALVHPMSDRMRNRYYDEQKLVAAASGVPADECPPTWDEFRRYMARVMAEDLEVTQVTREVAAGLGPYLRPPLSWMLGPLQHVVVAALLPHWLRAELGLRYGSAEDGLLRAGAALSRAACRLSPRGIRDQPARFLTTRQAPLNLHPPRSLLRAASAGAPLG